MTKKEEPQSTQNPNEEAWGNELLGQSIIRVKDFLVVREQGNAQDDIIAQIGDNPLRHSDLQTMIMASIVNDETVTRLADGQEIPISELSESEVKNILRGIIREHRIKQEIMQQLFGGIAQIFQGGGAPEGDDELTPPPGTNLH